jgi:flagellar biosynthesis protein FlhF
MNVKRFTARTSREAMALVKQAFGADAVVLSNKPCPEGVEVLAMAPEAMGEIANVAAKAPRISSSIRASAAAVAKPASSRGSFAERARMEPSLGGQADPLMGDVSQDVNTLSMSTLSFQDYVRERVLKRRKAEIEGVQEPTFAAPPPAPVMHRAMAEPKQYSQPGVTSMTEARKQRAQQQLEMMALRRPEPPPAPRSPPVLRDEIRIPQAQREQLSSLGEGASLGRRDQADMMSELRSVKGMIEERFGALAFMEKLQRQPVQARLTQKLLEIGFSPALVRKLLE